MPVSKQVLVKKSNSTKIAEYDAKHNKMVRGQFLTYGIKGSKDIQLTYKIKGGNVHKRKAFNGDIFELPFGYIKYLNNHGSIKRVTSKRFLLKDADGNNIKVRVEDNERRYSFRVLDPLSSAEMEELDPTLLYRANFE